MQKMVYICDQCNQEFECEPGLDFKAAWESAKEEGWVCFKSNEGVWNHKCPECRGERE